MNRLTLRLTEEAAARVRAHAADTYPHECCGALLGLEQQGEREIVQAFPLVNRREDSRRSRFTITADDVRAAEAAARAAELEVLGWYHSHPDHPALPSEYDREHAWPWYSYVIVSVERGEPKVLASWRLRDDRVRFDPERLRVETGANV
jgi:proteasome lid subunit RPN8/RPN11